MSDEFPKSIKISYKDLLAFLVYSRSLENLKLIWGTRIETLQSSRKHYTFRISPDGTFDVHEKDETTGLYDTLLAGKFDPLEYLENISHILFEEVKDIKDDKYSNYELFIIKNKDKFLEVVSKFSNKKRKEVTFNLSLMEELPIEDVFNGIEEVSKIVPFSELPSNFDFGYVINKNDERDVKLLFKMEDKLILLKPLDWILWMIEKFRVKLVKCQKCNKMYPPFYSKCPNC